MDANGAQFWSWLLLALPVLFAIWVWRAPAGGLVVCGVAMIYSGAVLAGIMPLLGVAAGTGITAAGVVLVAIGAALRAVLAALRETGPARVAREIDRMMAARSRKDQPGSGLP